MEGDNQAQNMINALVHDRYPHCAGLDLWDGHMAPKVNAPKGIIANVNRSPREDVQKYFDEVTHVELPARLVREARAEDIENFNTLPVWDLVKHRSAGT